MQHLSQADLDEKNARVTHIQSVAASEPLYHLAMFEERDAEMAKRLKELPASCEVVVAVAGAVSATAAAMASQPQLHTCFGVLQGATRNLPPTWVGWPTWSRRTLQSRQRAAWAVRQSILHCPCRTTHPVWSAFGRRSLHPRCTGPGLCFRGPRVHRLAAGWHTAVAHLLQLSAGQLPGVQPGRRRGEGHAALPSAAHSVQSCGGGGRAFAM